MADQPVRTPSPEVSGDDRLWVLLEFLLAPILPLITLFMADKKDRPFIKYHTIPTLVLGVVEGIVVGILSLIPIIQCLTPLIWIINLVLGLRANKGVNVDIPVITKLTQDQGWS
jgi:uncharacterized membrane protein